MMLDHYEDYGPLHATAEWIAEMAAKGVALCWRDNGNGWACLHPLPCGVHPAPRCVACQHPAHDGEVCTAWVAGTYPFPEPDICGCGPTKAGPA